VQGRKLGRCMKKATIGRRHKEARVRWMKKNASNGARLSSILKTET